MCVSGIDHAAYPTLQPEEMIAFYKRLGFAILREEEWRQGKSPYFSIQAGNSKINVHGPGMHRDPAFTLRAVTAAPGCGDLCFVWEGGAEAARDMLLAAGAEVIEGPVRRSGGRPGAGPALSVYTRDPDGNLLEFLSYPGA